MESAILITGASSGIGKQISIDLSQNSSIILCGRDFQRLKKTESLCNSHHTHYIWQYDLTLVNNIESAFSDFLTKNNIVVTDFVHCSGYMKMLPLKILKLEEIEKSFNTNVISAALITKVLIKRLNNSALRSCVFISSNISNRGAKAFSAYGASKSALDGLMRNLSIELAPKVRINSILPGAIETEMTKDIFGNNELRNAMEKEYPLGLGTPSDISNLVKFLVSDNSKWITGQQFTVDGGRTINITG